MITDHGGAILAGALCADDGRKFRGVEGAQGVGAQVPARRELRESTQDFLLAVAFEDEQAIEAPAVQS